MAAVEVSNSSNFRTHDQSAIRQLITLSEGIFAWPIQNVQYHVGNSLLTPWDVRFWDAFPPKTARLRQIKCSLAFWFRTDITVHQFPTVWHRLVHTVYQPWFIQSINTFNFSITLFCFVCYWSEYYPYERKESVPRMVHIHYGYDLICTTIHQLLYFSTFFTHYPSALFTSFCTFPAFGIGFLWPSEIKYYFQL